MAETVKLEEAESKAREGTAAGGGIAGWWRRVDDTARKKHPELWKLFLWMVMGFISNVPELGAYLGTLAWFTRLGVVNLGFFGFMEKVIPPDPAYTLATVVYAYMISTAIGYGIAILAPVIVTILKSLVGA